MKMPIKKKLLHTKGFNPFFYEPAEIAAELQQVFADKMAVSEVEAVYYYGAGCSDTMRCEMMAQGLHPVFPHSKIEVSHDLEGSARATCGNDPGIACIIGTGSNSCYYDGTKIIDHVPNLGFLMGDEGSGSHLSKKLLRCYFYREMSQDLAEKFRARFNIEERAFLNKVYSHHAPNTYLASFAIFLSENKTHPLIQEIIKSSIGEFLDRHPCKYPGYQKLPIHFVGSIAFHFKDILKESMEERNLILGKLIQKPIEPLLEYHLNQIEKNRKADIHEQEH